MPRRKLLMVRNPGDSGAREGIALAVPLPRGGTATDVVAVAAAIASNDT